MKRDAKGRFAKKVPDGPTPERKAGLDALVEKAKADIASVVETAPAKLGLGFTAGITGSAGVSATPAKPPVPVVPRWYGEQPKYTATEELLGFSESWASVGVAVAVIPGVTASDGQIVPCIVFKNQPGFYRTGWLWGYDLGEARDIALCFNENLGMTETEAFGILLSSIQAEARPAKKTGVGFRVA